MSNINEMAFADSTGPQKADNPVWKANVAWRGLRLGEGRCRGLTSWLDVARDAIARNDPRLLEKVLPSLKAETLHYWYPWIDLKTVSENRFVLEFHQLAVQKGNFLVLRRLMELFPVASSTSYWQVLSAVESCDAADCVEYVCRVMSPDDLKEPLAVKTLTTWYNLRFGRLLKIARKALGKLPLPLDVRSVFAAWSGDLETIQADWQAIQRVDMSLPPRMLRHAAVRNNAKIVKFLLDQGVSVHAAFVTRHAVSHGVREGSLRDLVEQRFDLEETLEAAVAGIGGGSDDLDERGGLGEGVHG